MGGIGGNLLPCLAFTTLQPVDFIGQRGYHGVDRGHDRHLHGLERLVKVDDKRIGGAAVGHKIVALQHLLIVAANLLRQHCVVDACIGRQDFVGPLAHLLPDVLGHVELVLKLKQLLAGLVGLVQVESGIGSDIGHHVLAFVGRYVLVDIAQLGLDGPEFLVDKLRSADCLLVDIFHPLLVVDHIEAVEHVLGTEGILVVEREVDNRRVVVVELHLQPVVESSSHSLDAAMRHLDGAVVLAHIVGGGVDYDIAHRCLGDGAEAHGHRLDLLLDAVDDKVAQFHDTAAGQLEGEIDRLLLTGVGQDDVDRQRAAVEDVVVEGALDGILHVEVQLTHHLLHVGGRLERDHLVVEVGVALADAHAGELAELARNR